jgi:3-hydroxybutyryl-CoA dehydrogenase
MPPSPPPERLGIAGSGTIACGLAACALERAFEVTLWARSEESAQRAGVALELEAQKRDDTEALARLSVTTDLQGLERSTLIVEAVAEDEYVKRQLFQDAAPVLDGDVLLATTTSSLSVTDLSRAAPHPASFFGFHVFNPVARMTLVELCFPGEATPQTRARATALCAALGKRAVEVPDEPGFVVNRLLFPYLFDAVRLLERTGLDPERIDACMKLGASYPMGPLELLDFVGLDVADAIGEAIHADTGDPSHRPPGRIKQMVGERRLGRKTGEGFYRYD